PRAAPPLATPPAPLCPLLHRSAVDLIDASAGRGAAWGAAAAARVGASGAARGGVGGRAGAGSLRGVVRTEGGLRVVAGGGRWRRRRGVRGRTVRVPSTAAGSASSGVDLLVPPAFAGLAVSASACFVQALAIGRRHDE
ncbi:hypothetical protein U9M48_032963, partial [Paspalum notatum var. saurae]